MSTEETKENAIFEYGAAYTQLLEEFPKEAYTTDSSRGFDLTSIKPQYIVERLNTSVGIDGWMHRGTYKEVEGGILFEGQLVIDNASGRGIVREAVGFAPLKRNVGDAYKGAKTDSLSKCASMFGVGNSVFKGLISPPTKSTKKAAPKKSSSKAPSLDF